MGKIKWWIAFPVFTIVCVLAFTACRKSNLHTEETPNTKADAAKNELQTETGAEETTARRAGTEGAVLAGGGSGVITYEIKREEKEYTAEDGMPIFKLQLAYPVIAGTEEGSMRINRYFEQWAEKKRMEYEDDENSTLQAALEVYRESRDTGWAGPWSERTEPVFVKTWDGYVSVLMHSYLYENENPGLPFREGYVFKLEDGREAELFELLKLERTEADSFLRDRFSKVVSEGKKGEFFDNAPELIQEKSMEDFGFYFTDTGICIFLPPYELGPYESGYAELEIPYDKIISE